MDYEIQKPNNFNDYLAEKREFKIRNKEQILNDLMERQIKNKRKHKVTGIIRRNDRLDEKKPRMDEDYYALPQDIYERGADMDKSKSKREVDFTPPIITGDVKNKPAVNTGEDAYQQRLAKTVNHKDTQSNSKSSFKDPSNQPQNQPKEKPKKFPLELRNIEKTEYLKEDLKELVPYCTNIIIDDNIYLIFSNESDRDRCRQEISGKIFGKKRIKIV
ncbi:hypothetical protein HK103_005921 [Boothiomyces macroporosus]|uniref:Uncharacterized protein n=1 Tax=Boothiomyces macroporosus TaxID=261099 RepID=A0AAD5Y6E7_9FUNG|nr:hypothetical protein HK103_005921 [Boothiomyces macroporosus]